MIEQSAVLAVEVGQLDADAIGLQPGHEWGEYLKVVMRYTERVHIAVKLARLGGNKAETARRLGISRHALDGKLRVPGAVVSRGGAKGP